MTKMARARYTLEFKQEAVRLVEAGQSIAATARTLGVVDQTLFNWVKAKRQGKLTGAEGKAVSARANGDQSLARGKRTAEDGARHLGKGDGVLHRCALAKYAAAQPRIQHPG